MTTPASQLAPSVFRDLGSKLYRLTDAEVLEIAALLQKREHDPQARKGLAILRPRLRLLRLPRGLDARRLFCMPFEMLLSEDQMPTDPIRRIARAAVLPAWTQVSARLPAEVLADAEAAAAEAQSVLDPDLQQPAARLWAAAAAVVADDFDAIAASVGEPQWLRDIGAALVGHRWIAEVRRQLRCEGLPRPPEDQAREIAGMIRNAIDLGEDIGFVTALVAAAHFRSPGSLVGALLDNRVGVTPGPGQAVIRRLCEAVGVDLEREIAGLQASNGADPHAFIATLDSLATGLKGLQGFADKAGDPELKLEVDRVLHAARTAAVEEVLPRMHRTAGDNLDGAVQEALSGESFDTALMVEDSMAALRRARPAAEALGVAPAVDRAVSDLLAAVRARATAEVPGESPSDREARIMALARYVELLEGPDAAQACLDEWLAAAMQAA